MRTMMLVLAVLIASPVDAREDAYVDMAVDDNENINYDYADVLRADPTYEVIRIPEDRQECADLMTGASDDRVVHDVAVDHQDSDGLDILPSGEPANGGLDCETFMEEVLDERRISGYDVEYRYKGRLYRSHMGYDPGDKLRIRITIAPAD